MRVWSLDPKYLDQKGLVAAWREGLLAKKCLEFYVNKEVCGYQNHPQLERFKSASDPVGAINAVLASICNEAHSRGYKFDPKKVGEPNFNVVIPVQHGQVSYEISRLFGKLLVRDQTKLAELYYSDVTELHNLARPFKVVPGGIESWEKV